MREGISTVVLLVRPGTSARRSSEILHWLRCLVPAALLVVSSAPFDAGPADDVITLRADDIEAGPLSVADALGKARGRREG